MKFKTERKFKINDRTHQIHKQTPHLWNKNYNGVKSLNLRYKQQSFKNSMFNHISNSHKNVKSLKCYNPILTFNYGSNQNLISNSNISTDINISNNNTINNSSTKLTSTTVNSYLSSNTSKCVNDIFANSNVIQVPQSHETLSTNPKSKSKSIFNAKIAKNDRNNPNNMYMLKFKQNRIVSNSINPLKECEISSTSSKMSEVTIIMILIYFQNLHFQIEMFKQIRQVYMTYY